MIKTQIVLDMRNGALVSHPCSGLAVNMEVAKWLFKVCGWYIPKSPFPFIMETSGEEEEIELEPEKYIYLPERDKIWILGAEMVLN